MGVVGIKSAFDPARPLLADPGAMPWLSASEFGPTMVIAPHPDDESLGCGGAIAKLVDLGAEVRVVFVSDGTKSHPNSRRYPAEALRDLREAEARHALEILGPGPRMTFLRLPDTAVPGVGCVGFDAAVDRVVLLLRESRAETILIPWRRDPHCDHRACHAIARAAVAAMARPSRVLEYPIWVYAAADPDDAPAPGEVVAWRLDVADVLPRKRAAIAAHRSQTTGLIDDDPAGFRLTAEMLARFDHPWEVFLGSPR